MRVAYTFINKLEPVADPGIIQWVDITMIYGNPISFEIKYV